MAHTEQEVEIARTLLEMEDIMQGMVRRLLDIAETTTSQPALTRSIVHVVNVISEVGGANPNRPDSVLDILMHQVLNIPTSAFHAAGSTSCCDGCAAISDANCVCGDFCDYGEWHLLCDGTCASGAGHAQMSMFI